eukprot:PhM_4_TR18730/c0_g1_i1/m.65793
MFNIFMCLIFSVLVRAVTNDELLHTLTRAETQNIVEYYFRHDTTYHLNKSITSWMPVEASTPDASTSVCFRPDTAAALLPSMWDVTLPFIPGDSRTSNSISAAAMPSNKSDLRTDYASPMCACFNVELLAVVDGNLTVVRRGSGLVQAVYFSHIPNKPHAFSTGAVFTSSIDPVGAVVEDPAVAVRVDESRLPVVSRNQTLRNSTGGIVVPTLTRLRAIPC